MYEKIVLTNTIHFRYVKHEQRRCDLCDSNLVTSIWKSINVCLKIKTNSGINYRCVRCITKKNRKRHTKTPQELDYFVNNLLLNKLKP